MAAAARFQQYLDYKANGGGGAPDYSAGLQNRAKEQFAKLIHARPTEVAFVPSATVGENLVAAALDIPRSGGRQ